MATQTTDDEKTTAFYQVLDDNSTSKFFVEYNGFLSNHISQGIIALHRLGGDKERLKRFVAWYQERLETPTGSTAKSQEKENCPGTIADLLGARKEFYRIYQYYSDKFEAEYRCNIDALVRGEFPKLSKGLVGSLLHGLIQLGYGCAARSPRIILEGLAYLHHSYLPIQTSKDWDIADKFGSSDTDPGTICEELQQNHPLRDYMLKEVQSDRLKNWNSPPQRRLAALLENKGDYLMDLVFKVKGPKDMSCDSMEDAITAARWVLDTAILVYTKAVNKNDFVLLHGVTSAWSLLQIVQVLRDNKQAFDAVVTFMCVLFATYMAQDSPKLNNGEAELKYTDWDEIVKATLSRDADEHVYKLVQVCHELSTATENEDLKTVYKEAANTALVHDISFIKY